MKKLLTTMIVALATITSFAGYSTINVVNGKKEITNFYRIPDKVAKVLCVDIWNYDDTGTIELKHITNVNKIDYVYDITTNDVVKSDDKIELTNIYAFVRPNKMFNTPFYMCSGYDYSPRSDYANGYWKLSCIELDGSYRWDFSHYKPEYVYNSDLDVEPVWTMVSDYSFIRSFNSERFDENLGNNMYLLNTFVADESVPEDIPVPEIQVFYDPFAGDEDEISIKNEIKYATQEYITNNVERVATNKEIDTTILSTNVTGNAQSFNVSDKNIFIFLGDYIEAEGSILENETGKVKLILQK